MVGSETRNNPPEAVPFPATFINSKSFVGSHTLTLPVALSAYTISKSPSKSKSPTAVGPSELFGTVPPEIMFKFLRTVIVLVTKFTPYTTEPATISFPGFDDKISTTTTSVAHLPPATDCPSTPIGRDALTKGNLVNVVNAASITKTSLPIIISGMPSSSISAILGEPQGVSVGKSDLSLYIVFVPPVSLKT